MKQRNTILIVDDVETNRTIFNEMFCNEYQILEATNVDETMKLLREHLNSIAIILLNIGMAQKQGYLVLEQMGRKTLLENIPVMVTSTVSAQENEIKILDMGASDIVQIPFRSNIIRKRICNLIEQFRYKNYLEKVVSTRVEKLQKANESMIDILSSVIEHRNITEIPHVRRVRELTELLLKEVRQTYFEYGLSEEIMICMASACALHDIGKILIPDDILNKKGRLTKEEFEIMKTHSVKGMELLNHMGIFEERDFLQYALDVCRYHHERWDGNGYPEGLHGDEIPLCAQVAGLIDCYDALTTARPYKPAVSHDEAVNMILDGECGEFSHRLLQCFMKVEREFSKLITKNSEENQQSIQPLKKLEDLENHLPIPNLSYLRYISSVKYLDSIIIVVDISKDSYDRIYPKYCEFSLLPERGLLSQDVQWLIKTYVHPEDQTRIYMGYKWYLCDGKEEIHLERSSEVRLLNSVHSGYSWYQMSVMSLKEFRKNNQFIVVLKNIHDIKMLRKQNTKLVNILSELTYGLDYLSDTIQNPMLEKLKVLAHGNIETSEEQLQSLLDRFNDTVFEYNLESGKVSYSENFVNKFGSCTPCTLEELDKFVQTTIHPDDFDLYYKNFKCLLQGEKVEAVEFRYKNNYGQYIWCQKRTTVLYNEQQMPVKIIGMMMDITYYKNENAKLLEKSKRDLMTGLYNKATVQRFIEKCFCESTNEQTHAMIVFDIDNFKRINDTRGHLIGDHAIKSVAKRILAHTRTNDIVGRVGGDEFVFLMKNVQDKKNIEMKVEQLMQSMEPTNEENRITVSVGIAIYPKDGKDYEELFCHADEALYRSKRAGKNQWCFFS